MLNKRIISFKTINTLHNGKNIATLINDEIIDLGIRDKIFTITLDKASNNDVAVDPQFCPSTLAFILWVSHSPIVLI